MSRECVCCERARDTRVESFMYISRDKIDKFQPGSACTLARSLCLARPLAPPLVWPASARVCVCEYHMTNCTIFLWYRMCVTRSREGHQLHTHVRARTQRFDRKSIVAPPPPTPCMRDAWGGGEGSISRCGDFRSLLFDVPRWWFASRRRSSRFKSARPCIYHNVIY